MKLLSTAWTIGLLILLSCNQKPTQNEQVPSEDQTEPEMADNSINILIGTYTSDEGSKGVYSVAFNTATEEFGPVELVAETASPSFLTMSKDKSSLFVVNELVPDGMISSFSKNSDGRWQEQSQVSALAVHHVISQSMIKSR